MSGETSSRARTLPCTWTTRGDGVLDQQRRVDGRPAGPGDRGLGGPAAPTSPRRCTARPGDSRIATASAASRTAGSAGPRPESIALRVAFTSSIIRATITLNRWRLDQLLGLVHRAVGDLAQRHVAAVGGDARAPRSRRRSAARRAAGTQRTGRATCRPSRCRPRAGRRRPASAGPRPRRTPRVARPGLRRCPATCVILGAWLMTMPWFSSAENGSPKSTQAHVVQHLGEEARVQQVQDRVLDAADVEVDGHPRVDRRRVERPGCRRAGEQ